MWHRRQNTRMRTTACRILGDVDEFDQAVLAFVRDDCARGNVWTDVHQGLQVPIRCFATHQIGDSAYASKERSLEADRAEGDIVWATPFKRKKGQDLTDEQRRINRLTSGFRSKVEHVFRVVKRQFGYTKARYRGLYKNSQQIFCQLTLANIYIMREQLA